MTRCDRCMFYEHMTDMGECRHSPPKANGESRGEFPMTRPDDWCGKGITVIGVK